MVAQAITGSATMTDADTLLVERCQQNDLEAFEELVRRYQNRIYSFVCKTTNDPTEAEDLTQETFLRVYKSIHRFRGESTFQTWLYRIAHNICVDRSRRSQRQVPVAFSLDAPHDDDGETGPRELPDESRNPARVAERGELQRLVRHCLSQMSEKLRTVIILYDLQGLSYEEIAETLACPLGTVKSRLFNARAELGRRLQFYIEAR